MNIQPLSRATARLPRFPYCCGGCDVAQVFALDVNAPVRRKRSELIQESGLRRSVRLRESTELRLHHCLI